MINLFFNFNPQNFLKFYTLKTIIIIVMLNVLFILQNLLIIFIKY